MLHLRRARFAPRQRLSRMHRARLVPSEQDRLTSKIMLMSAFELTKFGGIHEGQGEGPAPPLALSGAANIICRDAEHRLCRRAQSGSGDLQAAGPDSMEQGGCARRAKRRGGWRSEQARLLRGLHQM